MARKRFPAGSDITVANGEKAPSSILYTDVAGGKTNYLPIRAISELLGISIDYDSSTKTVLLDSQAEGDWVADGYNGYVVDPNGVKAEVPASFRKLPDGLITRMCIGLLMYLWMLWLS